MMLESALKFLEEIHDSGYDAYIVGGFVRDYLLQIDSHDIDIATNATPKQMKEMFRDSVLSSEEYGSVIIVRSGVRFEVTTFREEINYIDNRRPSEIKYIDDLYTDLLRRDFTVNTICMNYKGEIIDLLNAREELDLKLIKTVGNPYTKLEEDSLRILRAIRFATILDFQLDEDLIQAIKMRKHLLRNLSYQRKKEELDKIFSSSNRFKGIMLLRDLELDTDLELPNLKLIENTDSLIGIWSILNVTDKYPFTNNEKELINDINEAVGINNLDPMNLYTYGLYVNTIAGEIKGIDKKKIAKAYSRLAIKCRKDICITGDDIMEALHKESGNYLKAIYDDIEYSILYHKIQNTRESILKYILSKYSS